MKLLLQLMIIFGFILSMSSCDNNKEDNDSDSIKVTINGFISDTQNQPIENVDIKVLESNTSRKEVATTQSKSDGTFSVDVPSRTLFFMFIKEGYSKVGITVPVAKYAGETIALKPIMEFAQASIKGRVLDETNANKPLKGVKVNIGVKEMLTDENGDFLFENLTIQDYNIVIEKEGSKPFKYAVTKDMFKDGKVTIPDAIIGGLPIFNDMSVSELKRVAPWYVNEYRGGHNRGPGRVDWNASFMSAQFFNWVGNWEMQNEGCTLRIKNDSKDQSNPADLEKFDTYTFGRKLITNDNKILSINCRCHQASAENPVLWGVQIIDLSVPNPSIDIIGDVREIINGGDYKTHNFDLSDYVGKEVIVAIGHFRAKTGDYWNQLCLAHVAFGPSETSGDNYLPGEEVPGLSGWNMTKEMVRSTMPNPKNKFIGYSIEGVNVKDKSNPAFHDWAGTDHIASEWAFQYVSTTAEPMNVEGFTIKTKAGVEENYDCPNAYLYSKIPISSGHNIMNLRVRNFDSKIPTIFKLTVIKEDCTVEHLEPMKVNALQSSKVENGSGCWSFVHEKGSKGSADDYALFQYDLSKYNNQNIMVCIGVYKGKCQNQEGEQKLVIHSVSFE